MGKYYSIILLFTTLHMLMWLLVYRIKKGKMDPFDPFYITTGLYALIFIYGPWIWIQRGQTSYQGVEVMKYMPNAMMVFNLSYFVFALFSMSNNNAIKMNSFESENDTYIAFLEEPYIQAYIAKFGFWVYLTSMILALIYYRLIGRSLWFMLTLGQGSELRQIREGYGVYFLMQFIRSAIPGILLVIAFSKKKKMLVIIGAYLLCAVCVSTGSRNLAICVVLAIVVYKYLNEGKRPSKLMILLGIIVLYLFVGLMGLFRGNIKAGSDMNFSTINTASLFSAFMYNIEIFYPFFTLVGYLSVGQISYHYGLGILNIIIQFIPRAIWTNKPSYLGLSAFQAMYGNSMGGAAYPNIGEFYYELGIFGVIIGMIIFARVSQKLFSSARITHNKIQMIEYGIFFGYLMQFICRGHFPSWALDIVFMFGPIWLLKKRLWLKYLDWQYKQNY